MQRRPYRPAPHGSTWQGQILERLRRDLVNHGWNATAVIRIVQIVQPYIDEAVRRGIALEKARSDGNQH